MRGKLGISQRKGVPFGESEYTDKIYREKRVKMVWDMSENFY